MLPRLRFGCEASTARGRYCELKGVCEGPFEMIGNKGKLMLGCILVSLHNLLLQERLRPIHENPLNR